MQKLEDGGGAKSSYDGMTGNGSNRKTSKARDYNEWQGKVKGGMKHTYGVDGKNDPD